MGREELADALRSDGARQVRRVWEEAEQAAATAAEGVARELQALRLELRRRRRQLLTERTAAGRQAAQERLSERRGEVRQQLVERARQLAEGLLAQLVGATRRGELFRALVDELPECTWEEMQVCQEDLAAARSRFPGGKTVVDEDAVAGLLVRTEQGRIEIDNRLPTRLRRGWPEVATALYHRLSSGFEGEDVLAGTETSVGDA